MSHWKERFYNLSHNAKLSHSLIFPLYRLGVGGCFHEGAVWNNWRILLCFGRGSFELAILVAEGLEDDTAPHLCACVMLRLLCLVNIYMICFCSCHIL